MPRTLTKDQQMEEKIKERITVGFGLGTTEKALIKFLVVARNEATELSMKLQEMVKKQEEIIKEQSKLLEEREKEITELRDLVKKKDEDASKQRVKDLGYATHWLATFRTLFAFTRPLLDSIGYSIKYFLPNADISTIYSRRSTNAGDTQQFPKPFICIWANNPRFVNRPIPGQPSHITRTAVCALYLSSNCKGKKNLITNDDFNVVFQDRYNTKIVLLDMDREKGTRSYRFAESHTDHTLYMDPFIVSDGSIRDLMKSVLSVYLDKVHKGRILASSVVPGREELRASLKNESRELRMKNGKDHMSIFVLDDKGGIEQRKDKMEEEKEKSSR